MEKLIVSGHTVGEANYHIVLVPAYRQDIFVSKIIQELTIYYIFQKLQQLRVNILSSEFGPDHLHLFVSNVRFVSEVELVRQIKGYSSFMMRREYWDLFRDKLWGDKFWTYGHFFRSVGEVNKETIRKYIEESQSKHWGEIEQKTLASFS